MKQIVSVLLFLFTVIVSFAQPNIPVNGPKNTLPAYAVFTHATIYTDYKTKLTDATLIIKDGEVVNAGKDLPIPKEARVFNCSGKTIYPGFIDLYTDYGINFKTERKEGNENQMLSSKSGAYAWNEAIRSELKAAEMFRYEESKAKTFRESGFSEVVTGVQDGICRGSSVFVFTANKRDHELIIQPEIASGYSFSKGSSMQPYPSSLTGVIALLRQTYYDARWYKTQTKEKNISLEGFIRLQSLPAIFNVDNKLDIIRADKIATEFKTKYIIKGAGDEYQRISEIKSTQCALIIPVNFPKPFDVDNQLEADRIATADLKHWELAPTNPGALKKAGIEFAITSKGCENSSEFLKNLRKAVFYGLPPEDALKALTFTPAQFIHQEQRTGALTKGMYASFIITSGDLFDKTTLIMECWSGGERNIIQTGSNKNILGEYTLDGTPYSKLKITGTMQKPSASLIGKDTLKSTIMAEAGIFQVNFKQKNKIVSLAFWITQTDSATMPFQSTQLQGQLNDTGSATLNFNAVLLNKLNADTPKKETVQTIQTTKVSYPFTDFGWTEKPSVEKILFRNATIWTNESDSILTNTDLLCENGKIKTTGKNLSADGARVIDATGKFLTSGIIDEHSHIALTRGVNEGTQAVTAEVRMGDVVNSEDINIYRQLSGGVVASQLLHGSANPVGGQSALIKLRWGSSPEQMKIEGADGFIKFALGENVKQSNWGDRATFRYPQTRMGVEQIYVDAFTRARQYEKNKSGHTDLELETLLEILNKKRFITCHSYVQSEINMLMHVADSFGFRINTFTHILEGYKVADKMKKHGVGASTFADWWAYKYEVMEAIPYNAAILNRMGVVTAINSDDAEMGRRLNQEAAKTMKYGGVSEMDAWKMVTLNPAKLLHLDQHMGSIKVGKDADLVLWTDNPLSVYAKVAYTFVDGVCYYDAAKDLSMKEDMAKERRRIIQKMIGEKMDGEKTEKKVSVIPDEYTCETETDYGR